MSVTTLFLGIRDCGIKTESFSTLSVTVTARTREDRELRMPNNTSILVSLNGVSFNLSLSTACTLAGEYARDWCVHCQQSRIEHADYRKCIFGPTSFTSKKTQPDEPFAIAVIEAFQSYIDENPEEPTPLLVWDSGPRSARFAYEEFIETPEEREDRLFDESMAQAERYDREWGQPPKHCPRPRAHYTVCYFNRIEKGKDVDD